MLTSLHPADLADAISRAALAASRARLLPRRWVAVAVEHNGLRYVVVLGQHPMLPVAAVYRIRSDLRLKRMVRPPWAVLHLARTIAETGPAVMVPHPGMTAGQVMTDARMEQLPRCEHS